MSGNMERFILGVTHEITEDGLLACVDFRDSPPDTEEHQCREMPDESLEIYAGGSSNASARVPSGEWKRL